MTTDETPATQAITAEQMVLLDKAYRRCGSLYERSRKITNEGKISFNINKIKEGNKLLVEARKIHIHLRETIKSMIDLWGKDKAYPLIKKIEALEWAGNTNMFGKNHKPTISGARYRDAIKMREEIESTWRVNFTIDPKPPIKPPTEFINELTKISTHPPITDGMAPSGFGEK